jgi:hypothetical protein
MASEVPTFRKTVKRLHRIHKSKGTYPVSDHLNQADLPQGVITKVHRDIAIHESALRDWYEERTEPGSEK